MLVMTTIDYTPTLNAYIDQYPDDTPEDAAERILHEVPVELFFPLLRDAIVARRRELTREVEHELDEALVLATVEEQPPVKRGGAKRRYVRNPVAVERHIGLMGRKFYDGERYVAYADATVADLTHRIAYLQTKIDGHVRTLDFTQRLRSTLERSTATRLGDIPAEDLARIWAEMKDAGEID